MKVQIKLTKKQIEQLQPLFDEAISKPRQGFVISQAWDVGYAVFEFCTPNELIEKIDQAEEEAKDKTIKPARWVKR